MSNKKMSNERYERETVADNVSANHQFREVAKMIPHEEVAVSKMETTTPTSEKSSVVGNAAAMRKALESVRNWCLNRLFNSPHQVTVEGLLSVVNTALAKPPRNCDVGTEEEQNERFLKFCTSIDCERYCPLFKADSCELAWAQMPYEEGGAE